LPAVCAHAQTQLSINFSVKSGLPSNELYQVIEDHLGYIWISSDEGVSRFNGRDFETYTTDDGLESNIVFQMFEDPEHRLWFASITGKLSYYESGEFYRYKYNNLIDSISGTKQVLGIDVSEDQTVTLGYMEDGMYQISPSGKVKRLDSQKEHSLIFVKSAGEHLVVSTHNSTGDSLIIGYNQGGISSQFTMSIKQRGLVSACSIDKNIFISIENVLLKFSPQFELLRKVTLSRRILRVNPRWGELEVSLYRGGIQMMDTELNLLENGNFLNGTSPLRSFLDSENGTWVPTLRNGLFYTKSAAIKYHDTLFNHSGHPSNFVVDNNGSLIYFSSDEMEFFVKRTNPDFLGKTTTLGTIRRRSQVGELFLLADHSRNSTLFIEPRAIYSLNPLNERITMLAQFNGIGPVRDAVWHRNQLYIAAGTSVYKWDSTTKYPVSIVNDQQRLRANCLESGSEGLLIGSNTGLWKFKNGTLERLLIDQHLHHSIVDVVQTTADSYVLATDGAGLFHLDENGSHQITTKDGLNSNSINRLFLSGEAVFATTNKGINRIQGLRRPLSTSVISTLDQTDILPNGKLTHLVLNDDRVYVNFDNHLISFEQELMNEQGTQPKLLLKTLKINDSVFDFSREILLKHFQCNIFITYDGISFKEGDQLTYEYRLLGLGEKWVTTRDRMLNFPKLQPGEYQLQIRCGSGKGTDNDHQSIFFTILPPFWETLEFQLATFCFIITLVYVVFRWRIRVTRIRTEKNNRILDLQQQALHSQMDPHFVYNSLGSIQAFIITGQPEKSAKYISKFSKLMRKLFNNSNASFVAIAEEMSILRSYIELEVMRCTFPVDYAFDIDPEIDQNKTMLPPMLIQPVVENVFKHAFVDPGNGCSLTIRLLKRKGYLECSIIDNGSGYQSKKSERAKSGSNITQMRLELICEKTGVDNDYKISENLADGSGTIVTFRIPFKLSVS